MAGIRVVRIRGAAVASVVSQPEALAFRLSQTNRNTRYAWLLANPEFDNSQSGGHMMVGSFLDHD